MTVEWVLKIRSVAFRWSCIIWGRAGKLMRCFNVLSVQWDGGHSSINQRGYIGPSWMLALHCLQDDACFSRGFIFRFQLPFHWFESYIMIDRVEENPKQQRIWVWRVRRCLDLQNSSCCHVFCSSLGSQPLCSIVFIVSSEMKHNGNEGHWERQLSLEAYCLFSARWI
jgi:hypothetical protein